jgi:hypothetical protein
MSRKRSIQDAKGGDDGAVPAASKPAKAPATRKGDQSIHIRDVVTPVPLVDGGKFAKVVSWNVNGLKATGRVEGLKQLITIHAPDFLFLQETKIQEGVVEEYRALLEGYDSYWNCSTVKKGYAGTVSV